jgi:hypothetical protein
MDIMDNNVEVREVVASVIIKVLTNDEMHLRKLNEYCYQNNEYVKFYRSLVVTKAIGERFIKYNKIH